MDEGRNVLIMLPVGLYKNVPTSIRWNTGAVDVIRLFCLDFIDYVVIHLWIVFSYQKLKLIMGMIVC
jgi:hypothetical protein